MSGKASRAELWALWRELLAELRTAMRAPKRPSVETLQVTRKYLKDNFVVSPLDDRGRADLVELQRLYLQRLVQAMHQGPVTSSLLGEVRQFLIWLGYSPNVPPQHASSATKELLDLEVPFGIDKNKH